MIPLGRPFARWRRPLVALALTAITSALTLPWSSSAPAQPLAPSVEARGLSELHRLFPREADIFVEREGLVYLTLPVDVIKESRPDLSDVRIFNADGSEVPFLVNTSLPRRPPGAAERVEAQPIDVRQARRREKDGESKKRERIVVEVPESPPRAGAWDLVLTTNL